MEGSRTKWLKEQAEWAIDLYQQIRPPLIQRVAGYVILFGLGLLVVSFNDLLFEYVLKPVGFDRRGSTAPTVAVILVIAGLATLILDRIADHYPSQTKEQDKELYRRILEILSWDELDSLLNNLHNHWYWRTQFLQLMDLCGFVEDEANMFVDKQVRSAMARYVSDIKAMKSFMAQEFSPEDNRMERSIMLPDIAIDRTGRAHPRYLEADRKIHELIGAVETSYRRLAVKARSRGLITRQTAPA